MRILFSACTFLLLASVATAQAQPQLNLMPMPASLQAGTGQLAINQSFSVANTGFHDASLDEEVQRFVTQLSRQTGIPFRPQAGSTPTLEIHADHGRQAVQTLGEDESYELTVADSGAKLTAPTTLVHPAGSCRHFCSWCKSLRLVSRRLPSSLKISRAFRGAVCSLT